MLVSISISTCPSFWLSYSIAAFSLSIAIYMQTDTESPHHKETSMKISDIKPLPTGVFQLEDGCCKWNASEALAVIAFGRMHTELATKPFGDEGHVL